MCVTNYLKSLVIFFATLTTAAPAFAQTFPDHVVRIIVGAPPGGGLDVLARGIAEGLTERWGKAVIVENRAGASGIVSATTVASAPPDGYTLLAVTDQMYLANRFTFRKLPYDPSAFVNISLIAVANQLVLVNSGLPIKTMDDLVLFDRKEPGALIYGDWGDGSTPQLLFETLNKDAGTKFLGVPYKGVAPVMVALIANEVQLSVVSGGTAAPLLKSGAVRPIAIAAASRAPEFPDVPTTAEAGFPQLRASIWCGLSAPPGTPPALAERISADVRDIAKQQAFIDRFVKPQGWSLVASTPAQMDAVIQEQLPTIRGMIANAGVEPQ
jgi:tripartite-type tricarboxylate transporter receptor subunit TctC